MNSAIALPSRLQKLCASVVEATWLAVLLVVPLFFNVYSQRVFEPDKISILRSLALVAFAFWIIKVVAGFTGKREEQQESDNDIEQRSWWRKPLVLPVVILAAVYLLSTAFSVNIFTSFWGSYQRLQGTFTMLSYMVFFFVVLDMLRTTQQWRRLQYAVILTSLPIALYGIMQHYQLDPLPWGGPTVERITANSGNAIFLGAYLIMVIPLTVERLSAATKRMLSAEDAATIDALSAGVLLFVLFTQLLAVLFTQSRGPWLGLAAGGYVFVLLALTALRRQMPDQRHLSLSDFLRAGAMGVAGFLLVIFGLFAVLRLPGLPGIVILVLTAGAALALYVVPLLKRRGWHWLWFSVIVQGILLVVLIVSINVGNTALNTGFKQIPYFGRLAQLMEVDEGTGRVRVLIWGGIVDMLTSNEPLQYPDGEPDSLAAVRPLIGYGPETLWVTYNRYYNPELGGLERRRASPDRSHNETFDNLVINGILGFLAYILVFAGAFYYALKWLGLISRRRDTWLFAVFGVAGATMGVLIPWLAGVVPFAGMGVAAGFIGGIILFITYAAVRGSEIVVQLDRRSLLIITLLATVVAHFVEIHSGIAVVSSRIYFFIYIAAMVVIGTGQLTFAENELPVAEKQEKVAPKGRSRRRSRRAPGRTAAVRPLWRTLLPYIFLVAMIILVLNWDFVTNPQRSTNAFVVFLSSWLASQGNGLIWVLLFTLLVGIVLALGDELHQFHQLRDIVQVIISFVAIALAVWLIFGLIQGGRMTPFEDGTPIEVAANYVANHIVSFYLGLLAVLILLAASVWLAGPASAKSWGSRPLLAGGVGAVFLILALIVIVRVNVSLVRADILFKLGQGSDSMRDSRGSLVYYGMAHEAAPREDHYELFRGRALLEVANTAEDAAQQAEFFDQAEEVLTGARALNPLNTDHSANLARYYGRRSNLSSDPATRTALLQQAADAYQQATTLSPNSAHLQNEWSTVNLYLNDLDGARERLTTSITLDPDYYDTYLRLGELEIRARDWEAAAASFQKAIEINPGHARAYSGLGSVLYQLGQVDESITAYQTALEIRPNDVAAAHALATIFADQGDYNTALTFAEYALERAQPDQSSLIAELIAELQAQINGS